MVVWEKTRTFVLTQFPRTELFTKEKAGSPMV